jgi:tetratricopeptide (TPR) repeat protein
MRIIAALVLLTLNVITGKAQVQPAMIDSLKQKIADAKSDEEKLEYLGSISKILMNVNLPEADKYGFQMITIAEQSRNRSLMVKALLTNGERYSYLAGRKENIEKAINYYKQGLELARVNNLDELIVSSYLYLSEVHRYIPDLEKALNYSNQAFSYAGLLKNDSLTARVYYELGSVYHSRTERLLCLRNYLSGLRLAEETKNPTLLRAGYTRLSTFYAGLEDYDRAIDYLSKAVKALDEIRTSQSRYNRVVDMNRMAELYGLKKDFEMAMYYYERSIEMSDSLKYDPIKVLGYRGIVNNYLAADQPAKALAYFNEHPQLKNFLMQVNFGHFIDQSYGYIYMMLGKYDSAKYYYNRVKSFFEQSANASNEYSYYFQLGHLYRKTGELDKSLDNFLKAEKMAAQIGNLEQMSKVALQLDSIYQAKGDFRQALYFTTLNTKYKDSIESLGKEKDIMQAEARDEQQRQQRIERELAEQKRRKNNIQYLGITIGIVAFFVLLVVLGMFKVSATAIKMIGFFAFIMFFEFIFLVFKKNIYSITKGEPLLDLLFMIGLAALLLPLHHYLEEKAIHYLTSHNRLTAAGKHIKMKLFRRKAGS